VADTGLVNGRAKVKHQRRVGFAGFNASNVLDDLDYLLIFY